MNCYRCWAKDTAANFVLGEALFSLLFVSPNKITQYNETLHHARLWTKEGLLVLSS